ncbi:transforming growth factor beta regulator 1 [Oratosquilla oratoria]|uniref:transforming growth factor beta regulator 1 n=1 Tax=Oratosquilla oratoria TaxID=337810 RepID=UPI003F77303E
MSSVWNTAESLLLESSVQDALVQSPGSSPKLQNKPSGTYGLASHSVAKYEVALHGGLQGPANMEVGLAQEMSDNSGISNVSSGKSSGDKKIAAAPSSIASVAAAAAAAALSAASMRGGEKAGRARASLPAAIAERLARHKQEEQQVYRSKYKFLKRVIKSLVFENAALCDQVAEVQEQVLIASEERRFLLKRLCQHQNAADMESQLQGNYMVLGGGSIENKDKKTKISQLKRKQSESSQGLNNSGGGSGSGPTPDKPAKVKKSSSSKPKRLCPPITLDSAGRPIFPIILGPLTIHSLGEIVSDREAYHTEHHIFPVGFCSSRTYASLSDPMKPVLYTCKILDGGNVPRFEIVCEDAEDAVVAGRSPAECHSYILMSINKALGMNLLNIRPSEGKDANDRGCRFFGLSHPSVQNVLQACPGARKCSKYKWVRFEVCRSEAEVERVFESEKEASLCHEALRRNIRFARHHVSSNS